MKTLKKVLFLSLFIAAMFITAQSKGYDVSANLGLSYGFGLKEAGVRLAASYYLNPDMRVGLEFTYFFPSITSPTKVNKSLIPKQINYKWTHTEIMIHFHYFFHKMEKLKFFGIGTTGFHMECYTSGQMSHTDHLITMGIGAGAEYSLSFANVFAEIETFFLKGFRQVKLTGGIRYKFLIK